MENLLYPPGFSFFHWTRQYPTMSCKRWLYVANDKTVIYYACLCYSCYCSSEEYYSTYDPVPESFLLTHHQPDPHSSKYYTNCLHYITLRYCVVSAPMVMLLELLSYLSLWHIISFWTSWILSCVIKINQCFVDGVWCLQDEIKIIEYRENQMSVAYCTRRLFYIIVYAWTLILQGYCLTDIMQRIMRFIKQTRIL